MKDRCVVCREKTEYDVNDHVDVRLYYVEGSGQLCEECYNEIYGEE